MNIPVYWLAQDHTCSNCRWDEFSVRELIDGVKAPGWWVQADHVTTNYIEPGPAAIVCFPAGAHKPDTVAWLNRELRKLERVILFLTSDEAQEFPIADIKHPHLLLWVMLPRPENEYPEGTMFLTEGGTGAVPKVVEKDRDWFFAGQINHDRRRQMLAVLDRLVKGDELVPTAEFTQGLERSTYFEKLEHAKVAPAPAGACSQSSFRCQEALTLGCVPVVDAVRDGGDGRGFWDMVAPGHPFTLIDDWNQFPSILAYELRNWPERAVECHSWWHLHRRHLAQVLHQQIRDVFDISPSRPTMTVIIPTSPIPSHPSTKVLEDTVASIRERTDAEILITMDGVRKEQTDAWNDYFEYQRRVLLLAEQWDNVTPIHFRPHLHQAEMLRRTLRDHVATDLILYVEHDTPLVNEIDFDKVIDTMVLQDLNCVRFYHETAVHPEHMHLMVDDRPRGGMRRTMQWSQRPHLARASWYRQVLRDHFGAGARTMIEDVMFGAVEHDWLIRGADGWGKWGIAIYEPGGNIQRSVHLDGREGQSKFSMKFAYPEGTRPPGTPNPDWNGT